MPALKVFQCGASHRAFYSWKAQRLHVVNSWLFRKALDKKNAKKHSDITRTQTELTVPDDVHEHIKNRWGQWAVGEAPLDGPSTHTDLQNPEVHIEEVEHAFDKLAGTSLGTHNTTFEQLQEEQKSGHFGVFGPFLDQQEWELADQTKIDRFLNLDITCQRTGLSFQDNRSVLQQIYKLPQGPPWKCHTITMKGDVLNENGKPIQEDIDIWCQDPVECVYFHDAMKYEPECMFSDESEEEQIINEMWTMQWWWDMQEKLPSSATIAPVILAPDKTQLSQFSGDNQAWPVYISIGNICKACLHEKSCKGAGFRLFHFLMSILLEPLIAAGKNGVRITCAHWHIHMVYPILAAYIADFPEQCLIAGVQQSDCPICEIDSDDRGEPSHAPFPDSVHALSSLKDWVAEGVFKDHLVKWCLMHACAAEIDQRFQCMPDHLSLRYFKKGISTIMQWTGHNSRRCNASIWCIAHAVIDFIYYTSYHSQSTETLRRLQDALNTFHQHKETFIHIMEHYIALIQAKGTPDGFNTELSERLHIDFAKEGYQASNKKN
ncbi:hypothetical protein JB92DRAFT_3086534 [Gautieria morchelliformis]|nr:hypothetical protein JB92DRAFT_3086534 [Gautieria morchelliformis]